MCVKYHQVDYFGSPDHVIRTAIAHGLSLQMTGRWTRELIRNEHGGCIGAKMICSECGQDNGYDKRMKFCPNCGSKMEVEE